MVLDVITVSNVRTVKTSLSLVKMRILMEEKLGDEEGGRQHTFQSLGNEGNEVTG